jgi:hypothetical protein
VTCLDGGFATDYYNRAICPAAVFDYRCSLEGGVGPAVRVAAGVCGGVVPAGDGETEFMAESSRRLGGSDSSCGFVGSATDSLASRTIFEPESNICWVSRLI